jgi:hypothetical protein
MADKNSENENGDDLEYGTQRKDIITPIRTQKGGDENSNEMNGHENWAKIEGANENTNEMNGHESWTRNGKPNRNDQK